MLFDYHPKLVERMVRDTPKTLGTVVSLSLLLIWVYSPYVPNKIIYCWSLAQSIFILLRYSNYKILKKHLSNNDNKKIRFNIIIFIILISYSAVLWTIGTISWTFYSPPNYEFISIIFVIGIISGGSLSLSPIYFAYIVYFCIMLLPHLVLFTTYGDRPHFFIVLCSILFVPYIYMISKSMHDSIKGEISRNELLEKNVIKLRELSTTDPLTNISNRRHFFDVSENILNLSRRENINISLLMIDIDFFKKLNDAYGHQFGDIVLIKTAESIKNITRSCDVFSRMGGEEFALLLYGTPRKNALKLAEKICKTIEKTTIDNGVNRTNITVSIGVSEINKVIDTIPLLYKDADEKLYLAKESGRNCVK